MRYNSIMNLSLSFYLLSLNVSLSSLRSVSNLLYICSLSIRLSTKVSSRLYRIICPPVTYFFIRNESVILLQQIQTNPKRHFQHYKFNSTRLTCFVFAALFCLLNCQLHVCLFHWPYLANFSLFSSLQYS